MDRAVSPVVGTLLLTAVTVVIVAVLLTTLGSASLGGAAFGQDSADPTRFVRLSADVSPDGRVLLTHEGGDPIDVSAVTVTVAVDGTPLPEQPPVPFFSTAGYDPGPTGPFNSAANQTWTVGEQASFTIAESNGPALETGSEVVLTVSKDGRRLARASSVLGDDAHGDDGE